MTRENCAETRANDQGSELERDAEYSGDGISHSNFRGMGVSEYSAPCIGRSATLFYDHYGKLTYVFAAK